MLYRFFSRLGWPILLTLCFIPIFFWMTMLPLSDRFSTTYLILTSIGRLSGLAAIVCYCFNLILTTRLRIMEDLFGGLNKTFIAHHIIGGTALVLALIHATSLVLRLTSVSISDAARLSLPFTTDWPTTFGVLGLWSFIVLMILTFYISLPYKVWLLTHKFLGPVFLLIALHILLITGDLTTNLRLKWYMIVLFALATISYVYRTLLPRFFARRYKYTVSNVANVGPGTVRISMRPGSRRIDFKPGQFIFVSFRMTGFSKEWHPFTISSNTIEEGLSITVKSLGKYTDSLIRLVPGMVGSEVFIEGAYGKFSFRNFKSKRQIWVAGGIGITPFLSMVPDVKPDYKIDLYYSVKSEAELIDLKTMQKWESQSNNSLKIIPYVSEKSGLLSIDKITKQSGSLSNCEILLCGPPPMMKAIREQLKQNDIKNSKIHSEEFALS